MASFEFTGAPMIAETFEFGPQQASIVTTMRDLVLVTIPVTLGVFLAGVVIVQFWFSLPVALISAIIGALTAFFVVIVATQRLRDLYGGEQWTWELLLVIWSLFCRFGYFTIDQKGHLAPRGRRVFTAAWVPGLSHYRSGTNRDLAAISTSERQYGGTTRHIRPPAVCLFDIDRKGALWLGREDIQDHMSEWVTIEPWMLAGAGVAMPSPLELHNRNLPPPVPSTVRYRHHDERADANVWYGGVMLLIGILFLIAITIAIAAFSIGNNALYLHGDVSKARRVGVEW